jgi:hypothetical protein
METDTPLGGWICLSVSGCVTYKGKGGGVTCGSYS